MVKIVDIVSPSVSPNRETMMAVEKKYVTEKHEIPAIDKQINTTGEPRKQQDEEECENVHIDTKQGEDTAKQQNKKLQKPAEN